MAERKQRSDWFSDTNPKALEIFIRRQREMDSGEKLMLMFDLSDILTAFASADERARRPEATERDIFLRVASRRLGAELTARVYGWTG